MKSIKPSRLSFVPAAAAMLVAMMTALPSCTTEGEGAIDSEELVGAPEETGSNDNAISSSYPAGTKLKSTTNVNLRSGPSTSKSVLLVIPSGSTVTLVEPNPSNGFYKVKHNGTVGWSFGQYYNVVETPSTGTTVTGERAEAIDRAKAGVGFSYWWGHGRWKMDGATASNKGSCAGSCPNCSHSGSYGADCSGYVAKIWQVGSNNTDVSVDKHPYSTANFNQDGSLWSTVSRGSVKPADALVYNSNGAGHIILYTDGDGWNSMYAYECKGCAAGCVAGLRTASSSYHAIRKTGW
jgi:cell wall-associated NlpC family hydrolase